MATSMYSPQEAGFISNTCRSEGARFSGIYTKRNQKNRPQHSRDTDLSRLKGTRNPNSSFLSVYFLIAGMLVLMTACTPQASMDDNDAPPSGTVEINKTTPTPPSGDMVNPTSERPVEGAPLETTENYTILERFDEGNAERIYALSHQQAPTEEEARRILDLILSDSCPESCNILLYDDPKAYEQEKAKLKLADREALSVWEEEHFTFVADHFVGQLLFDGRMFNYYPLRSTDQYKNS